LISFLKHYQKEDRMRQKFDPQGYLDWSIGSRAKTVRLYEEKYNRVSKILDETPKFLELVHKDLKPLSRGDKRGRKAQYTSENILRALVVHQIEGTSLRDTMIRLAHSAFLQAFVRLGVRKVMDYSMLDKCFKAIQPETWQKLNGALRDYAVAQGRLDPSILRVDTTVVEANIHWPTDSSLLWDSWRTLYRLLDAARAELPGGIESRFHGGKVKKLHLFITRYAASPSKKRQRKVRKTQRKFLEQVERIVCVSRDFARVAKKTDDLMIVAIALEIESYLPKIRKVQEAASRVWLNGEVVPAADRIFSIFEDHVELIKRGRRHKPVEFGHMVLLGQSREKFITQYDVMEKRIPDSKLPESVLERHKEAFGRLPEELAADKGFCGKPEVMAKLREKVKLVAIPQRLRDWVEKAFVALQHFRAGIEGSISVLKRAFGLLRCRYRGFKSFVSNVALGVFCHNLVMLTGPPGK
jgi:IS5 family transposase